MDEAGVAGELGAQIEELGGGVAVVGEDEGRDRDAAWAGQHAGCEAGGFGGVGDLQVRAGFVEGGVRAEGGGDGGGEDAGVDRGGRGVGRGVGGEGGGVGDGLRVEDGFDGVFVREEGDGHDGAGREGEECEGRVAEQTTHEAGREGAWLGGGGGGGGGCVAGYVVCVDSWERSVWVVY